MGGQQGGQQRGGGGQQGGFGGGGFGGGGQMNPYADRAAPMYPGMFGYSPQGGPQTVSGGGGPQQMPQGQPMPAQGYQGTGASTGMDPNQIAQIMSGGGGATGGAGMPPPSYGPGGPGQDMNAWLAQQPQGGGQPGVPPSTGMDPNQIAQLMGGGMGMMGGGVPPVGSGLGPGFQGGFMGGGMQQQPWQNQTPQMPGNYDQNTGLWTGAPQGPQQIQSAPPPMPTMPWQPPGGGWGQPPGQQPPGQAAP